MKSRQGKALSTFWIFDFTFWDLVFFFFFSSRGFYEKKESVHQGVRLPHQDQEKEKKDALNRDI